MCLEFAPSKNLVKMKKDVESLTKDIMTNAKAMDDAEIEAELEKAREAQMKAHLADVAKSETRVKQLTKKLKPLQDEQEDLINQLSKSKKDEEQKRIKTDLETLGRSIAAVESELAAATKESQAEFVFKPPKGNVESKKSSGHLFVNKKDGQLLPLEVPGKIYPRLGSCLFQKSSVT